MPEIAHPNLIDMTGQRFGRWLVIRQASKCNARRDAYWECICDCGIERAVVGSSLRRGQSSSCGCLAREKTHGHSATPEYRIWGGMRSRCNNPHHTKYSMYGGRGIHVCERWDSFEAFYEDMGPRPSRKHSIDRIENNGPYSPENCRWATATEQGRNTRRNRYLTFQGETRTVAEWAEITGLNYYTLHNRIHRHKWPVSKALTTPVGIVVHEVDDV